MADRPTIPTYPMNSIDDVMATVRTEAPNNAGTVKIAFVPQVTAGVIPPEPVDGDYADATWDLNTPAGKQVRRAQILMGPGDKTPGINYMWVWFPDVPRQPHILCGPVRFGLPQ